MTVGACQQMIKGVSGRCHSLCCITNRLFPPLISAMPFSLRMGREKGLKIIIKKEERRNVYIKGDTASVESSGLGFRRLLHFILFFVSFRRGVQRIVVPWHRFHGKRQKRIFFLALFSLNLSIIFS